MTSCLPAIDQVCRAYKVRSERGLRALARWRAFEDGHRPVDICPLYVVCQPPKHCQKVETPRRGVSTTDHLTTDSLHSAGDSGVILSRERYEPTSGRWSGDASSSSVSAADQAKSVAPSPAPSRGSKYSRKPGRCNNVSVSARSEAASSFSA